MGRQLNTRQQCPQTSSVADSRQMSEPLTIENCRKAVFSDDVDQQLRGCCGLRSLLSLGEQKMCLDGASKQFHLTHSVSQPAWLLSSPELKPPIQEAIDAGVVPRLIEFLHQDKHSLLQV